MKSLNADSHFISLGSANWAHSEKYVLKVCQHGKMERGQSYHKKKKKKMEQYLKIRLLWAMHKETHELV